MQTLILDSNNRIKAKAEVHLHHVVPENFGFEQLREWRPWLFLPVPRWRWRHPGRACGPRLAGPLLPARSEAAVAPAATPGAGRCCCTTNNSFSYCHNPLMLLFLSLFPSWYGGCKQKVLYTCIRYCAVLWNEWLPQFISSIPAPNPPKYAPSQARASVVGIIYHFMFKAMISGEK